MSFIDAMHDAFGSDGETPPLDLGTMRGLIHHLRGWAEGKLDGSPLPTALDRMRARIGQALEDQARDLEAHPEMAPVMRTPLEGMLSTYREIHDVLTGLLESVGAGNRAVGARMADTLAHCGGALAGHQAEVEAWMSSEHPRCPRCGSGEPGSPAICETCKVDRLIPDREHLMDQSRRTAQLTPAYLLVHDAYQAVVEGKRPLKPLLDTLMLLEQEIWEQQHMAQGYAEKRESPAARRLLEKLEQGRLGIERMRQVAATRAMRDLNEGWKQVFQCSVDARYLAGDLFEEIPEEERAKILEQAATRPEAAEAFKSLMNPEDSVVLEGD